MIRKNSGILLLCFLIFQFSNAQDIPKLTVPTSPAFSILGFEPSAIMRPASAKSLATDVLNSFDKDGKLLMNLGLEVAPYWLKSHPGLTREKYLNPNFGQAFLQSFSISAGTVKDSATGNNKLGAGFRFRLSNGHPVDELKTVDNEIKDHTIITNVINNFRITLEDGDTKKALIDSIVKSLEEGKTDQKLISDFKTKAEALALKYGNTLDDLNKFLLQLDNDLIEADKELHKKSSELVYERKGFILEFAGATGYNSDSKGFERLGFWGNASYFVSPDDFFTLTARFMHQNNDTSLTNVDVGLGFLKKNKSYNLSIEGMLRWFRAEIPDVNINNQPITRLDKNLTYRLAVQGSYIVSKDISVNLSIGKDFNSPFISGTGVFSILGLNYSIFSKEPGGLK